MGEKERKKERQKGTTKERREVVKAVGGDGPYFGNMAGRKKHESNPPYNKKKRHERN